MNPKVHLNRDGDFRQDGIDIGDYLEAEFVGPLGVIAVIPGDGGTRVPVFGYDLLLTLSANAEPIRVVYTVASMRINQLFLNRVLGEKLVMRQVQKVYGKFKWCELVVNNQRAGMRGLEPA